MEGKRLFDFHEHVRINNEVRDVVVMYSGKRQITWFDGKLEKYHRPMSEIINTLNKAVCARSYIVCVPD